MPSDSLQDHDVCIVGLGYVGLTLAVAMADAGFQVHGVEISDAVLRALSEGRAHFLEAGLDARLAEQIRTGRFTFGRRLDDSVAARAYIVTVGTPVDDDKKVRIDSMRAVIADIGRVLRDGDIVILRSTVLVGTTRDIAKPALDATGRRYDLAFCPERTLEGKALAELRSLPQIVGGIDAASTSRAAQLFSRLTPTIVRVNDPETAELVKLVSNVQRDYIFAFANEVAAMCDALGLSAAEVIASGNLDYPRANLPVPGPVGGPCLEKDPYILAESLERVAFVPALAIAARRWNEELPQRTVATVAEAFARRSDTPPARIGLAGLAFKGRPETDDMRGTLAIPLVRHLREAFPAARLVGWDPAAGPEAIAALDIEPVASLDEIFKDTSILIIQNNHECFARMDLPALSAGMARPAIIYDLWTQHDPRTTRLAAGVDYHGLGAFSIGPVADPPPEMNRSCASS